LAAPTTCSVALRARIRRCRASPLLPKKRWRSHGDHRHGHSSLVRASGVLAGRAGQAEQRVDLVHDRLVRFGKSLSVEDEVVIEATGNSAAVERILRPFVKRVVVANPRMVRAIAYARVKTDKIDATILAKLHAGGFLPEVWVADEDTQRQRRQTAERMGVLEQVVRTKGRIQAILHANLIPKYSGHLFGKAGKKWLAGLPLLDRSVIVQRSFIEEAKPQLAADRILTTRADAVIVYGQELPSIIDAVTSITAGGKPVVTLCSDLPTSPRLAYVGIDHHSAGRTAAYFMTRIARRPGPVIVLTHCLDYRAHAQRIGGFRDWLSEHKADLSVACILEGRDAPDLSERLLAEALLGRADAIGIYNTSDANLAVSNVLHNTQRIGDVVFIGMSSLNRPGVCSLMAQWR
jgi:hypothetical protein